MPERLVVLGLRGLRGLLLVHLPLLVLVLKLVLLVLLLVQGRLIHGLPSVVLLLVDLRPPPHRLPGVWRTVHPPLLRNAAVLRVMVAGHVRKARPRRECKVPTKVVHPLGQR